MSQYDQAISDLFGWSHPPGNVFRPSRNRIDAILVEEQLHAEGWKICSDVEADGSAIVRLSKKGLFISKTSRTFMAALCEAARDAKRIESRMLLIAMLEEKQVVRVVTEGGNVIVGLVTSRFDRGFQGPQVWIKLLAVPLDWKPSSPTQDRIQLDRDFPIKSVTVAISNDMLPPLDLLYNEDGVARLYRVLVEQAPSPASAAPLPDSVGQLTG